MPGLVMPARRLAVAWVVGVALLAAGCDAAGPEPARTSGGSALDLRSEQAGFVLEVHLPSTAFTIEDTIPLETTLTWTGPKAKTTVWGSGSGLVTFLYGELGGAGRSMGGVMTADCHAYDLQRNVPLVVPPGKGWSTVGEDPNLAFYQAWAADPVLHLPSGTWRIVVASDGLLAPCDAAAAPLKQSIPFELTIR